MTNTKSTWRVKQKQAGRSKQPTAGPSNPAKVLAQIIHEAGHGVGSYTGQPTPIVIPSNTRARQTSTPNNNKGPAAVNASTPAAVNASTPASAAANTVASTSAVVNPPADSAPVNPPASVVASASVGTPAAPNTAAPALEKKRTRHSKRIAKTRNNSQAKAKAAAHLHAIKKQSKAAPRRHTAFNKVQRAVNMDRTAACLRIIPSALVNSGEECSVDCSDKKLKVSDLVIERTQAGTAYEGYTQRTVTYRHFECRSLQQSLRFFDKRAIEDLRDHLGPGQDINKLKDHPLPAPTSLIRHRTVNIKLWNQSIFLLAKDAVEGLKEPTAAPSVKRNPKRKEQREARRAVRKMHKERRRAALMMGTKAAGPEGAATQKRKRDAVKAARNKNKGKAKAAAEPGEDMDMHDVENNVLGDRDMDVGAD